MASWISRLKNGTALVTGPTIEVVAASTALEAEGYVRTSVIRRSNHTGQFYQWWHKRDAGER